MTSVSEVESVFEDVVEDVLDSGENSVSRRSGVNEGFCSIVAAEVYERLDEPGGMELCVASVGEQGGGAGSGGEHYWVEFDGLYFDAERTGGVEDWRELPYWVRYETPARFEYEPWVKYTGF